MLPRLFNQRDYAVSTVDKLFDELFKKEFPELYKETGLLLSQGSYPKVNVIDFEDKVEIVAEIAGLSKDDISIDVDEYVLTIAGVTKNNNTAKGAYLIRELKQSSFKRSFTFGDKFDMDKISAEFDNGILTIEVGKKQPEPKVTKTIEIKSNKKLLK